ncbi:MAG: SdpI family protein, partial [Candidatus Aminicenantes bacterium]|nr:SdpI family protein [Candidatus Aminicenantes bacterium]
PKRKELWNSRSYHLIFGVLLLFFALFPLVPYLYIKGLSNLKLINILIGVLFVFLGNYLPGIKPNYFVGIRTPWTLENETVWRKTHRVGGWSFVLIGILIIFSVFLPASWSTTVLLILVCAVAFFLVLYSYILWWKISKEK